MYLGQCTVKLNCWEIVEKDFFNFLNIIDHITIISASFVSDQPKFQWLNIMKSFILCHTKSNVEVPDQDILQDKFLPKSDLRIRLLSSCISTIFNLWLQRLLRKQSVGYCVGDFYCPGLELEYITPICILLIRLCYLAPPNYEEQENIVYFCPRHKRR